MKKIWTFFMVTCMLFLLVGCGAKSESEAGNPENSISAIDAEETYPATPASLAVTYNSVEEIVFDADVIARVSIGEQTVELLDGYPQTHTLVEVSNVLKGEVTEGDILEVVEEGGNNGKVLGGIPQLSDDYDYYLMLTEDNGYYYVCGAFQGRFIEREGYVFQQAAEDVKLSRSYSPLTSESLETLITEVMTADELS